MNLRQVRHFVEVVDAGFSVSRASTRLHTSQPSISRHLSSLEAELGAMLFVRSGKRLAALTPAGSEAVRVARRLLLEAENLKTVGRDHAEGEEGALTIAASHTHARYSLPPVVHAFRRKHPKVRLVLRQGEPAQITSWVATGGADLSISAEPINANPDVAFFPCHEYQRVILVPRKHPLLRVRRVTLKALARYPLITYDPSFKVYRQIMEVFTRAGLAPEFVLSATDVDVMKTYVKAGMGLAIVADLAYDPEEDRALRAIEATHLFPPVSIKIGIRRGAYVPGYAYDFIELFAPQLKRETIATAR